MDPPCSQFDLVNCSRVSNGLPVNAERTISGSLPNEEPSTTTNTTLAGRTLSSFTFYGELSVGSTPEQFASVHARLQQEWSFNGGFVRRFTTALLDFQLIYHPMYSS